MKLTYEDGHIVLRKPDGTLGWAIHSIDVESNRDQPKPTYEVDFKGTLTFTTLTMGKYTIQID